MKKNTTKKKSVAKAEVKGNSFPIVAIGASAGGLEAMLDLLKYLPTNTGMAFIYVQHLSPDHKSMLTEILSKKTRMKVQEISDMDKIKPDNVFVIPPNKGIEVTDGHIKLIPRSESGTTISIDVLFSSLAAAQKERVIGIILSGSASDGTIGIKTIKQEGGLTFAQDNTAKFTSMPNSAIATGMVDFILSPKEMALELARLSKHPLIKTIGVKNGEENLIDNRNPDLRVILNQLHKTTGVDFNAYKMNTIKRRIIRRMLLYKITTLKEYAKMLSQKKEELDILYQDLLISVTSFFRDTDTHKYLKENIFPKLLKRKKNGESLRIWVPACATGEEAYSIAMMLLEIQESKATTIPVQIFATDLSEQAIAKARIGFYAKQELETVSPKRIQRFFIKSEGSYRVNKAVRDMCVFAPHNILHDPPFSRLDFISCCNVFIYFDNPAQKKAVNTFHYALNDDGFLMLGKSENITQSANLFTSYNKKYKIFSRKINSGSRTLPTLLPRYAQQTYPKTNIPATDKNQIKSNNFVNHNALDNAIDAVLVSEFMPATVVINHQMEIVQFRGVTDLFLTHPQGNANLNILKMARPEIAFELRNAISKVIKTKHRVRRSGIELKINSDIKIISLEIVPLKYESEEPLLLVLFTEQEQTEIFSQHDEGRKNSSPAKDRRIKKLEQELVAAHANALANAQEQEAFAEELQSANEEVVSSNEELQTVNEELETSKEEIESAIEELTTTNQELQTRNDLLNESYEYSAAIVATIYEPLIVLDKNLRIKSANKAFYKKFSVTEEQTEGVLMYELGTGQWNIPILRQSLEEMIPKNSHFHDLEVTQTFPNVGEKTMLLNASRIIQKTHGEQLLLISIQDVTEQTNARKTIEQSQKQFITLVNSMANLAWMAKADGWIYWYNDKWYEYTGTTSKQVEGWGWQSVHDPVKLPLVMKNWQASLASGQKFEMTFPLMGADGKYKQFLTRVLPVKDDEGKVQHWFGTHTDVTEQQKFAGQLEEQVKDRTTELKASEDKFYKLFNFSPTSKTLADATSGKIVMVNDAFTNVFGYSREETLNKDGVELGMIDPAIRETLINELKANGKSQNKEIEFIKKSGERFFTLTSAEIVTIGNKQYFLAAYTDISDRKKAEKIIEQRNSDLLRLNKELEAFTYVSSHDLQEPLRKIKNFSGIILEEEISRLSDNGKNHFHIIQKEAKRMHTLIEDLLAFSRLSITDIKFESADLSKIIEEVKEEFKEAITQRNAVIEVKEISEVKIVPYQFRQLIHNLISNALKFSNPKIPPHIVIKSRNIKYSKLNVANLPPQKEYCHITVSDNGIGFEPKYQERIFEVFQRLHGKEKYAGTGIGLAIVKKIVDNHNGIITATSELNKGATFNIYIPAR